MDSSCISAETKPLIKKQWHFKQNRQLNVLTHKTGNIIYSWLLRLNFTT